MRTAASLVALLAACGTPGAGSLDAGTVDGGSALDPSCEGLLPTPPTTCEDRNGGCDPRASCLATDGGTSCRCGEDLVGDGFECHPPGWSFADAEPPIALDAVYDKCLDRVLVRGIGASPLWSLDPRAPEGSRYRRLPLDLAAPLRQQLPFQWGGKSMVLAGRSLFSAGISMEFEGTGFRYGVLRFDVDDGRAWERPALPPLSHLCADGPGRLLGIGGQTVLSIDSSSLESVDRTPEASGLAAMMCVEDALGGVARLVARREGGPWELGRWFDGGWRFSALPALPPPWDVASVERALAEPGGRILFAATAVSSATRRSVWGLWAIDAEAPRPDWNRLYYTDDADERVSWLAFDTRRSETLVGSFRFPSQTPTLPGRPTERVGRLRPGANVVEPFQRPVLRPRIPAFGSAAAVFDTSSNRVIEWGGESDNDVGRGMTVGLRAFDVASRRWTVPVERGDVPFPMLYAGAARSPIGGRILVFGGHNPFGPPPSNVVREIRFAEEAWWSMITTIGDGPPPLSGSIVTSDDRYLWVIGGQRLGPDGDEDRLEPENRAWRLELAARPARWLRVDDGSLPHVRFWPHRWSHRPATRGFVVPRLGLVAAGPSASGDREDQHFVFELGNPVTARPLVLPGGLPPVGIDETSASLYYDDVRSRLVVAGVDETWVVPVDREGALGSPLRLCGEGNGTAGWGFSVADGFLTAPSRRDGYVRLLDASTPACPE